MDAEYVIQNLDEVMSPSLIFYPEIIRRNIQEVIRIAGSPDRLCPHVKTHKTREIAQLQLEAGIRTHKCATIAEAEMLAQIGVPDVLIAYPLIGPNIARLRQLTVKYPQTRFSCLVDHPEGLAALQAGWADAPAKLPVLMDVDVGHHRTGIAASRAGYDLYRSLASSPNLSAAGFHVYDGHNHQEKRDDRETAVRQLIAPVLELRQSLQSEGIPVPRLICGGTPTFPIWARMDFPGMQCSPGTFVLHDQGYGSRYADLSGFKPAALVLTRVISKPMPRRLTLDLGHKAIAADPPAGKRCVLLNVEEYTPILQNEEHFGLETEQADRWHLGDAIYAIPAHICPTVALHRAAYIVENNRVVGEWEIASRNRKLTV